MFLCALEWHVLEIVVKTAEDTNVDNNNVNVVCRKYHAKLRSSQKNKNGMESSSPKCF